MDDRISSFPDEILSYIVSFLPTKQAVASSVLSKRWIFLWRSVSSFDFCSRDFDFDTDKGASHFIRSMESFLDRRDRDQPLHKFCLRFPSSHFDASDNGRLQRFSLYLDKHCPIPLLKFCKTLVVLKLTNLSLEDNFSVDLPLLKILHLNDVDLPEYVDLVFGCPDLEDLELNFMQCEIKGKINMFPKLVRVSINDDYCPLEIFKNVQVLTFDLWFQSNLDLGFDFHNLVQLEMDLHLSDDWLRVCEVLKHPPKLQSLVICIHQV
ncbi:FBD-associated F-box protein At4g10400 [Vigna angularis]|uniref:FBD-associated F-box protein At4g10400 n=1 Tax=Phaseolus angularis TaxID=3914 RepID=UPI0022B5E463|nr:FBD-associated F-box protein At4g10400 [Vigna angularis]